MAQSFKTVQVGGASSSSGSLFRFITPRIINAQPGDVITFQFKPGNHSVTQSSFNSPCTPLSGGFDSGWVFIPQDENSSAPTFSLTITDIHPIFFYCKQLSPTPHCIQGMVGAINIQSLNFEHFQMTAEEFKGIPGQRQGGLAGVGAKVSTGIVGVPSGATVYPVTSSTIGGSPSGTANGDLPTISITSHGGTSIPIPPLGGSVSASRAISTANVALSTASNVSYSTTIHGSSPENHPTAANIPTVTAGGVSKLKPRPGEMAGVVLGGLGIISVAIFLFLRSCKHTRDSTLKATENEVKLAESPSGPHIIYPFIIPPTTRLPGRLPQKFAAVSSQNNQIRIAVAGSTPVAREIAQGEAHIYQLCPERENLSHEASVADNFQSEMPQTQIWHLGERQRNQEWELLDLPPLYDSPSANMGPN